MDEIETPQIEEIITEDGVLCKIISFLTLKEAVRTCVLSRRWKYIWNNLPEFMFDTANVLDAVVVGYLHDKLVTEEAKYNLQLAFTMKFIRIVDSVLKLQQQQECFAGVEEFRVEFFLHKIHTPKLDAWVRFAVASKTKNLALYLQQDYSNLEVELYDFPFELLASSSSIEELSLASCSLKPPHGFRGLNHLARIYLYALDITEEDINCLLTCCAFSLKKLCLWKTGQWETLSIRQPLSQLRTLMVQDCGRLRRMEINAISLSRMRYWGVPMDFIFRQSSQLEYAEIYFQVDRNVDNLDLCMTKLPRNLPHLQSLTFQICNASKVPDLPKCSDSFFRLKRLDWSWKVGVKMSLDCLATLLNAAPLLELLKLRLPTQTEEPPPQNLGTLKKKLPRHPHSHLKAIKIYDFYCDKWQIEVALYLLNNAIFLKSMTIEKGSKNLTGIREMALKNLSQEAPANVKLVILQQC